MPGALVELSRHPYDQVVACSGNPRTSSEVAAYRQSADPRLSHTAGVPAGLPAGLGAFRRCLSGVVKLV